MFTILAIIGVIMIVIPSVIYALDSKNKYNDFFVNMIGGIIIIGVFIAAIFGALAAYYTYNYVKINTVADQKIAIYKEQNKDIEEKVGVVVDNYLSHEKDTYSNLKSNSKITLATMYPDLKSNTLIQEQIKLYNENNKKVTKCRIQKTKALFYRKLIVPFS